MTDMFCWLCGSETTNPSSPICKNEPCQICTEVTEIDEEIKQAATTLRRLIAKRCGILSEHNRVHGTLMNRLPVELKNYIFELLLPSRDEWGEISRMERATMPSFLASISVCRGWRNVALSNPFLWSTMDIMLETSDSSSRINDWILRSRNLPVTFHIIQLPGIGETVIGESRRVLEDVMSRCSDRLQSLSLDVPLSSLRGSRNNFQYHRLTRLRITSSPDYSNQPLSLLNPTASPEKIELEDVFLQSLQISWHRLTSAIIESLNLEDLSYLFQHALQMTFCRIFSLRSAPNDSSIPPIIHHGLKTLELRCDDDIFVTPILLGALVVPCLREFDTDNLFLLTQLPALINRSSCPLTKLTLLYHCIGEFPFDELQPVPGVTDLVIERLMEEGAEVIERLLLEGYFPDLRHLTLRLQPFEMLWQTGNLPFLLDRIRPLPDKPNEGRLHKFLVIDQNFSQFVWDSDLGQRLKAMTIGVREDGFEFL